MNTIKKILHNKKYDKNLISNPPSKNKNKIHTLIRSTKKQGGLLSHTAAKN
jgi:hypothetical protein